MKPITRRLQLSALLLISLSLGGCIILPHGHRHHDGHRDRGRYANEPNVIVVPAPQEQRGPGRWRGRGY